MSEIRKKLIGKRLSVTWLDPTGGIGTELAEIKLAECVTEGKLVKVTSDSIVLASSIYTDSTVGDYTCIHKSLVTKFTIIKC